MEKSADAFRTISEVADDLDLPQHVLRFWETRFPQIRPLKRAGGRRYYRPADIGLLRTIRILLYDEGYTIKGVQRLLKEQGTRGVIARSSETDDSAPDFAHHRHVDSPHDERARIDTAHVDTAMPATLSLDERSSAARASVHEHHAGLDAALDMPLDAPSNGELPASVSSRATLREVLTTLEACERMLRALRS